MYKRILSVFGANLFGQIITIIIQIVSIPFFLHFWGASLYGEWLILTALPTYLVVSGTGIGFVAGNTMHKHIVVKQDKEALYAFQSAWILTIGLSLFIFLIVLPIVLFAPVFKWVNIKYIINSDVRLILLVLIIYVLLTLQTELFNGVYRASGRFARGITVLNILRLLEFIGVMIVISVGLKTVATSVVYLGVRILGLLWMLADLKKLSWLSLGFKYAKKSIIKSELIPTFTFLGFPLGHAFLIQGMTTVVGIQLGANAVVVFCIIRTITGFIKQFSSTIYYSVWPEFSSSLSQGEFNDAKYLHRNAFQVTFLFSLLSAIALYFAGESIFNIWTGGKVSIDKNFFLLMLISSIPNTLWMMSSYVSISINKHARIAIVYSILAALSMLMTYQLCPYLGLLAVPVSTLFSDVFTLLFVMKCSFAIVQDRTKEFFYFMISNVPLKQIAKIKG